MLSDFFSSAYNPISASQSDSKFRFLTLLSDLNVQRSNAYFNILHLRAIHPRDTVLNMERSQRRIKIVSVKSALSKTYRVFLDGKHAKVTSVALQMMRRKMESRILCVDALCITQPRFVEQVKQTARLHSLAAQLLA